MYFSPPTGAFWHTAVRTMHSLWTYQYPPLYTINLLTAKSFNLVVAHDGFLCVTEIIHIFHIRIMATLITEVLF